MPWKPGEFGPSANLDAEFFPITAAERWGAIPVPDGAQVLSTPPEDQLHGVPRYVIAGGALSKSIDDKAEVFAVVLRATLHTVAEHNKGLGADPISRLGLWEGWFNFEAIGLDEVARRLTEALAI